MTESTTAERRWALVRSVLPTMPRTRIILLLAVTFMWLLSLNARDGFGWFFLFTGIIVVVALPLVRWARDGGVLAAVNLLRMTWGFAPGIRPEHAPVAARILASWQTVMERTAGTERVIQRQRQFQLPIENPFAMATGRFWAIQDVAVDRPPAILDVCSSDWSLDVTLQVPTGYDPVRYTKVDTYRSSWGVNDIRVAEPEPGVVKLSLMLDGDPLSAVLPYVENVRPDMLSYEAVPVGIDESGQLLKVGILESNCLLAGLPGGGKSGGLSALIAGISMLPNVALVGLDPKMVELLPWTPRFTAIATDLDQINDLLQALADEMRRRYDYLAKSGKKKFAVSDFTPEHPLIVVVADELAELVSTGSDKKGDDLRATLLRRLVAVGRASGVVVLCATQKPASDTIPTAFRDLIAQRIAFRTTNRQMTEMILGAGISESAPAEKLTHRGTCFSVTEGDTTPRRARFFWVPDDLTFEMANQTASLRVPLSWLEASPDASADPTMEVLS